MFARKIFAVASLALVAASCLGSDLTGPIDPEDATFAPSLGINLADMTRKDSGVYFQDLVPGSGEAATEGAELTVHYTGWQRDGTMFQTTEGGDTFTFTLELGEVITGWVDGLDGMLEGGVRKLVIPSHLGYGELGNPNAGIPGHAILIFDVELVAVTPPEDAEEV